MNLLTFGLIGAVLVALAPSSAAAQEVAVKNRAIELIRKAGVHLNTSVREPIDPDVSKGQTFGISIGLSPGRKSGWRYPVGLTMFSENLHAPSGEQFAVLNSTALIAGIGYGWRFGRLATSTSLQTGFAMNRGRLEDHAARAFRAPEGAVSLDVGHSPLLRYQVKGEYFLTEKLTLRASADYMMIRPGITVTTPTERMSNRWDASSVHANAGIGIYPFRR